MEKEQKESISYLLWSVFIVLILINIGYSFGKDFFQILNQ